ncbi:hypothetical protein EC957_007598 [Mortierella hygrophila]|uniref:Uncharacterized protein n=1 Tax=Mortierella hygrophila TaxID=979708 RepID=A0A9P6FBZ6_9FUNG|nr:hypothetical protein EC957_007598 [Mortierella hygrophila]
MLGTDTTVAGMETKWSGALSRLKNSSLKRKVDTYNCLAKMSRLDRRALFESAPQKRMLRKQYKKRLRINVITEKTVVGGRTDTQPGSSNQEPTVDSVLIEYAKGLKAEDPIHSFILDTSNPKIMRLFSADDQREIKEPTRPRVTPPLFSTLRNRLKTNDSDEITNYNDMEDLLEQ